MTSRQKLNLVYSLIIIGLFFTLLYVSITKNKEPIQQSDFDKRKVHQLMAVSQQKDILITGIVKASIVEEVKMKVNGKVDKNNRTLVEGSRFKKNEILIKVDRLEALYELLAVRSAFKELIQKLILSVNDQFPNEANKWWKFENQIQRTLPLPNMPILKSKNEEELLNRLNVYSLYYKAKKTERKAEDYIYLAPFNGTILESNTGAGLLVSEGNTVLKLAKSNSYQVTAHASIKDLERISNSDTVYFKSLEGDTLSKGVFLNAGHRLSDSSTFEAHYSIEIQNDKLLNKIVYGSIKAKPVKIPSVAIKNDSIEIYGSRNSYKLRIKTVLEVGDSTIVEGLPEHSILVIPFYKHGI